VLPKAISQVPALVIAVHGPSSMSYQAIDCRSNWIGQLSQFKSRYGEHLMLVLLPDFIDKAQQMMFTDACR
jgi:hypothetical protein